MSKIIDVDKKIEELKKFQDGFLESPDMAYFKLGNLPANDQWCGVENQDLLLLQRQKSMRDGYQSAYSEANEIIEVLEQENEKIKKLLKNCRHYVALCPALDNESYDRMNSLIKNIDELIKQ